MPHPEKPAATGAEAIVRITGPAHLGQGVGRVDGRVFMVPLTAVGDLARVRVAADHRTWVQANPVEILEPGPGRVTPICPVYGRCGGCHLQHLDDETRAAWKRSVFHDVLKRIGRVDAPSTVYTPASLAGWRCRVAMHYDGTSRDAGFYERASHTLVPPGLCPIAMEPVTRLLEPARLAMAGSGFPGTAECEIVAGADGRCVAVVTSDRGDVSRLHRAVSTIDGISGVMSRGRAGRWQTAGDRSIDWPTAGLPGQVTRMQVDPRGFTQAHMAMNPYLVDLVISMAAPSVDGAKVVELYAGAGNITVPLAMRGARVFATDINAPAIAAGARECLKRGLHVDSAAGPATLVLSALPEPCRVPDIVIADPPRSGMGPDAAAIAAMRAPRVVICSCEPSTLGRDIAVFCAAGYIVEKAAVVDMFPSTYHMEAVISLTFGL